MPKDFDFNLIKYLVAIVDTRSMTGASERLSLAPSGVSYAVKKLREYYNDPLFIREKSGVKPTPLALGLYELYIPILQDMALATEQLHLSVSIKRQRYRVRTNSVIEYWLSYYLLQSGVLTERNHLNYVPVTMDAEVRLNKLRRREVDLDIGLLLERDANIYSEHLFDISLTVICRQDHPRVGDFITEEEYLNEKYAIWSSIDVFSELSDSMEDFLERRDKNIVLSSNSLMTLILAVTHSDLLMIVPTFFIPLLMKNFMVREVSADFIKERKSHVYAYMHKYRKNDEFIRRVIEIMKSGGDYIPIIS